MYDATPQDEPPPPDPREHAAYVARRAAATVHVGGVVMLQTSILRAARAPTFDSAARDLRYVCSALGSRSGEEPCPLFRHEATDILNALEALMERTDAWARSPGRTAVLQAIPALIDKILVWSGQKSRSADKIDNNQRIEAMKSAAKASYLAREIAERMTPADAAPAAMPDNRLLFRFGLPTPDCPSHLDEAALHLEWAPESAAPAAHVVVGLRHVLAGVALGEHHAPGFDASALDMAAAQALHAVLRAGPSGVPDWQVIAGFEALHTLLELLASGALAFADPAILADALDQTEILANALDTSVKRDLIAGRGAPLARLNSLRAAEAPQPDAAVH